MFNMNTFYAQIKQQLKAYFETHWVSMLGTLLLSSISYGIIVFNIVIAFSNKYDALKFSVDANTVATAAIVKVHQEIITKETSIQQQVIDDHLLLEDVHLAILGTRNPLNK